MKKGWLVFIVLLVMATAVLLYAFRDRIFVKKVDDGGDESGNDDGSAAGVSEFPLKKGSRGDKVTALQKYLNSVLALAPLLDPELDVDGIFGDKTAQACATAFGEPVCSEANYKAYVEGKY